MAASDHNGDAPRLETEAESSPSRPTSPNHGQDTSTRVTLNGTADNNAEELPPEDVLNLEGAQPNDDENADTVDLQAPASPEEPAELDAAVTLTEPPTEPADGIEDTEPSEDVPPHVPSKPALSESAPVALEPEATSLPTQAASSGQTPTAPTHRRSLTLSKGHTVSIVLITSALETIASSKEAKRSAPLRESTQKALEMIRAGEGGDRQREIFEPLRLACETKNEKLMIASLDCISKLISYSFFVDASQPTFASPPPSPRAGTTSAPHPEQTQETLVDLVVQTITACHLETTPESVSLQIVKALLSLVLSPTVLVHHSSLLKAIRTVYNIFLLSTDPINQMVAQGGLTQMVNHVFSRCKVGGEPRPSTPTGSMHRDGSIPSSASRASVVSLPAHGASSSTSASFSDAPSEVPPLETNGPSNSANGAAHVHSITEATEDLGADDHIQVGMTLNDLFIKDAYLVFRSMCRLTMNPLNTESERDLKSHAMRSKLLSLHIILTLVNSYMPLFIDPSSIVYSNSTKEATSFVQAINQWLCLSLSRNAVSPVPQVFDLSVEIFWRVLSGMRTKLKKEIEVLMHEIFFPILEMKTSTLKQKAVILGMVSRLCQDPQALVEIYLNYDCDSDATDNIYEHIMDIVSKISATPAMPGQKPPTEPQSPATQPTTKANTPTTGPSLNTSPTTVPGSMDSSNLGQSESQLRRQALECLVTVLRSFVSWGTSAGKLEDTHPNPVSPGVRPSELQRSDSMNADASFDRLSTVGASTDNLRTQTPDITDDPGRFENAKQRKTTLLEGLKKFNFKPKKGIQFLLESGFIASRSPQDIATFLLNTDGLSKAMIGEYLGEGDAENIAIMHAFVDSMNFRDMSFVDALRTFLQKFRLPGEAQKIDRYVLKFADRYIACNASTPFANADTAYVLAFSTIMLNTDQHNPQVKKRMTKQDFTRNNRGINDGQNLPEDFMDAIFDEIANNEIRMQDEVEQIGPAPIAPGIAGALASVGRDLQKEAYVLQTSGMANKTEALFRTMMRSQRSRSVDTFFSASHYVHVRPMFEVGWIAFLAGLSGPLQETDDMEIVELCLDGFKSAIRVVCFFDLELERNAFVTTLAKFTFLNNLGEMKTKNMEAIKALLDIAVSDGNNLKGSWHEVLTCVSQLERMQLIGGGDTDTKKGKTKKVPNEELVNESRSTHITVAADMVFSLSHFLSGEAIVAFVRALSDVSWEEIQSSGLSQHPRLFSLQKLVEISYYNMNRIRIEWNNMWDILGDHFNQVCCHNNPHVGFFALDSLRQLAMRFLEKEELPHFKFQKDFLKPFEYTMTHNANPDIRDMVLQCLSQMVQAKVQNIRSGWRTMFGVFQAASRVLTERIANSAFEIVTRLNKDHFGAIVTNGAFSDLTVCITEFCKVSKYQKISLLAIAMLRGVIPVMLERPECGWSPDMSKDHLDDNMIKFWYPVLFGFYDIIMNGEDLEVRRLALDSLFTTLKTYGKTYPVEFWDTVCQELIFPIFSVLRSSQDLTRFNTQEDQSVWLSTTMIQALRDVIDLYTYYFEILERLLDGLLDLLCVCICQENDTLSHIGTSCLQQLIENNAQKLSSTRWERVIRTFLTLFKTTTPYSLFDENLRFELDPSATADLQEENSGQTIVPAPLSPNAESPMRVAQTSADRRRIFKQIIVKCVLQLLLIETVNDLLRNDKVFKSIPAENVLSLANALSHSYQFARDFNEDKDLRTGLWKVGFMKHLPNLLKQQSGSAATLIHVWFRVYFEYPDNRAEVMPNLMKTSTEILEDFNKLRSDGQGKNIIAWTPVVAEIVFAFCRFEEIDFKRYLQSLYPLVTELLARDVSPEIRLAVKTYYGRVGHTYRITA
ncbi:Sec7-domain-containing protein [Cylindrobasidium torrendii FP15055 ss-10]|uniref:Sec7-domain-containing protein n=1 Tax=Cylindrobasidium torrendii FP15055 ss-10 TaxID=1314674 RepID=A0A0D7BVU2_9AGAR|nr:Sec7-domain-containing protein [Cylindrobasidium torrendii FP15055 ss-10]